MVDFASDFGNHVYDQYLIKYGLEAARKGIFFTNGEASNIGMPDFCDVMADLLEKRITMIIGEKTG